MIIYIISRLGAFTCFPSGISPLQKPSLLDPECYLVLIARLDEKLLWAIYVIVVGNAPKRKKIRKAKGLAQIFRFFEMFNHRKIHHCTPFGACLLHALEFSPSRRGARLCMRHSVFRRILFSFAGQFCEPNSTCTCSLTSDDEEVHQAWVEQQR